MSDTPRTDSRLTAILDADGFVDQSNCPQRWVNHARELERELNAANQRIKQLEAVVNDPEVLWSNWLRGTVKLPSGIGDVRQYQARINRLEDWKESALAVEREWNANAIATMLGGQPGESQREVIQREVPKLLERIKRLEDGDAALTYSIGLDLQKDNEALKARIKRLEEAGDAMDKTAEPFVLDTIDEEIPMSDVVEQYEITYDSPPTAGDHVAMDRARKEWRKAKEDKP